MYFGVLNPAFINLPSSSVIQWTGFLSKMIKDWKYMNSRLSNGRSKWE